MTTQSVRFCGSFIQPFVEDKMNKYQQIYLNIRQVWKGTTSGKQRRVVDANCALLIKINNSKYFPTVLLLSCLPY